MRLSSLESLIKVYRYKVYNKKEEKALYILESTIFNTLGKKWNKYLCCHSVGWNVKCLEFLTATTRPGGNRLGDEGKELSGQNGLHSTLITFLMTPEANSGILIHRMSTHLSLPWTVLVCIYGPV